MELGILTVRAVGAGPWGRQPHVLHTAGIHRQTTEAGTFRLTGSHTFRLIRVPGVVRERSGKAGSPESECNLLLHVLSL